MALVFALLLIAICNPAAANSLGKIDDPQLRSYSEEELGLGAPSLGVTAKVLYKEALASLEAGDWKAAREKLEFCSALSPEFADPLFTLARVELMHGHPDFLYHLLKAFKCQAATFRRQALLAANGAVFISFSAIMTLFSLLLALSVKYWPMLDHRIRETYSRKYSFPPARSVGILVVLSLLIMRAGLALYISLLTVILWAFLSRKEKGFILFFLVIVSILSFLSPLSNVLVPGIDENSVTRRLSLLNERGARGPLIERIEAIDNPSFSAEKEYALGTLLYRLGRFDEARGHLLAAVSKRGDFAPAYLNLGNVYFMQYDYNKALAGFQNVLAIDSTNAVAHYNVGQTYINMMLFAQSNSALKKATDHGIEKFRESHPAIALRNISTYDGGFSSSELWSAAWTEGMERKNVLLDEILSPWLLFPFKWMGYLIALSLVAAILISRKASPGWRTSTCDNCGNVTCAECSCTETGITLCVECSAVIRGLESVKVMEALLRHRRQKVSSGRSSRGRLVVRLFPGAANAYLGRTGSAALIMLASIAGALLLAWRGSFFKDPYILNTSTPLWKIVTPLIMIASGYLASARMRAPQPQRNFRVLPPDFCIQEPQGREADTGRISRRQPGDRSQDDKFEEFLNSI